MYSLHFLLLLLNLGVEIAESTSADLNSPGGSDTEDASVSDSVKAEDGSCQVVDQPGNGKEVDKRRRHAVPEYMVLNVHNTQQSAELAIKDNMVKVDLSNYFKKEPEDASYDQAMVRNESMPAVVHIKDEPIDDEYEKSAASGNRISNISGYGFLLEPLCLHGDETLCNVYLCDIKATFLC